MRLPRSLRAVLAVALVASVLTVPPAVADHTGDPAGVALAGSFQDELGCPGDWQPECANTELTFDADDQVWQGSYTIPAGDWEYKAALNDTWDESYGNSGANISLSLGADTEVSFYYSHATHWVADTINSTIATVAGSFQSELGCPGDWSPDCLRSLMDDVDGDGIYQFATDAIPAGLYEFKVAMNEAWDVSYPGANVPFTVGDGDQVTVTFDPATTDVAVTVDAAPPPGPTSVTIAGSLQSELGCPGDWQPECGITHLVYDAVDDVWQATFPVPAGDWEYKAALNDTWDESYGLGGGSANIPLSVGALTDVKFYYDHASNWPTDNVNSTIATVAGSFQSQLGCPGDWQPECLRSWMQDLDGDGIYTFATDQIAGGSYEFKVALDEAWDASHPASNVPFTVADGATVTFTYDSATNEVTVDPGSGTSEPGDELLIREPVRVAAQADVFYFVLPDRFDNGDPSNDAGGDASGDPLVNGLLPTNTGYYHGGDLAGLTAQLPYLDGLGVTAIWLTPQFTNRWVQGDGTIDGSTAGYHGYWQIDYSSIDPHFGTNAEMTAFVDAAHALGIDVYFDIVANHTGDVISYAESANAPYISKEDAPYLDASGVPFDDADYAGTGTFPSLDADITFPYTPVVDAGDVDVKYPDFLDDPTLYHNRGNSTFSGENSLYGDFFGLDDLWTEHPMVQDGLIQVFKDMVTDYDIDGFRIDTVKHVNDEFWEAFGPELSTHAGSLGKDDFFMFGEVFDGDPGFTSRFTTELPLPAVLDFPFQGSVRTFASQSGDTDNLAGLYASDDYYTDADSNAYSLPLFLGNHDIGRFGLFVQQDNPGATDDELLARSKLAHALMFFGRGMPVVYYGDEQGFTGDAGDRGARQDMMASVVDSYNDDDLIGTDFTTADDNFDATHPLYMTISEYAATLAAHPTLANGAQLTRHSEASAGVFAFSRIDRTEKVEYLVVLNNSEADASATFDTDSPSTGFTEIWPGGGAGIATNSAGMATFDVPALGVKVYRADAGIAVPTTAPVVTMTTPGAGTEVLGRVEVGASLSNGAYTEVTFAVSIDGGAYEPIGTDDNAPYRVFYDVAELAPGTDVEFKAIADNMSGAISSDKVAVTVGSEEPPTASSFDYAVVHYNRPLDDYGDHTTGDFNDFWGLHLWGSAIDPGEVTDWTSPKPFLGEDEFGRFAWIRRGGSDSQVNFIIHQGDVKDGTDQDRFFDADVNPEIWINAGDATIYTTQADAQGYVTIRYHRDDGDYGDPTSSDFNDFWGLHLWGDAIDPSEATVWDTPKPFDGVDDFGAFWTVDIVDASLPVNFIIHRGDLKDPGPDESFIPADIPTVWKQSGDETIYPSRGAAEDVATIHYHRADGDYGDNSSPDFNDFWGLHVWDGALNPNPAWTDPVRWSEVDIFGPVFEVPLVDGAPQLAYIIHRGDQKDPGPDQFLTFDPWGYEVWQLEGPDPSTPDEPHYVLPIVGPGAAPGDIVTQQAHWVSADTIVWSAAGDPSVDYALCHAPAGGLTLGAVEIEGGTCLELSLGAPFDAPDGFLHLDGIPTLTIAPADLPLVPEVLTGQLAVQAIDAGVRVDATGIQIPGVLDDLYANNADLGVSWDGVIPMLSVWAPTAKSVSLHLYDDADPATGSTVHPMTRDDTTGVWSVVGASSWDGKYYEYDVEVYVHSTGQVESNLVTDPYSLSLSMNSGRSHVIDPDDPALAPDGWDSTAKPAVAAPEDIVIYELHVRDFSVYDETVPEAHRGTYKAFTEVGSDGMNHLSDLADAGLTHLHLLPVFDIATINEDKDEWQTPDPAVLATYPPDSDQQQATIEAVKDLDGFNWGYDPFHYTTPEGSYSTDPDGSARVFEFREMVQSLNDTGLRVVMDVVYNHTNASGQAEKSVLDQIVPGYYHRLNGDGIVETSTCCANTATEHVMMERLMIDSLVMWATMYKVDGFRFDLMGHHSLANMVNVRAALDALTLADDGVDGSSIYVYGEGWNFGEVANNARFVQATQLELGGTGIGTFNDRIRDAIRGGGPFDGGDSLVLNQGFVNGAYYDPNELVVANGGPGATEMEELLLSADQIRVGLAGNLADYQFEDRNGNLVTGSQVDYNGAPAGYTQDPQEHIAYASAHDNQTLFDVSQYHHPVALSMDDRVRAQNVALDVVALSQGVPFFHAGSDMLRSKSFDRDSFNSGDWFNAIDFSYGTTNWGNGLPVAEKNQADWPLMAPYLADPALAPAQADVEANVVHFQEILEVRASSPLFRLPTEADVTDRVEFHNTGVGQVPGVIVMSITDRVGNDLDPAYEGMWVVVNPTDDDVAVSAGAAAGLPLELHPVLAGSADPVVQTATFDEVTGTFEVPARTTAVFADLGPDVTAPEATADLEFLGANGRGRGFYRVVAACVDDRDPNPTVMATLNGVPVDDGQEVLFIQSARAKWEMRNGTLWFWGPRLRLVVECQDEAGNTDVDVATVQLRQGPRIN